MNESTWLLAEIDTAETTWAELMTRDLTNLSDTELLKHARDRAYWAGYADAMNNAYNRIFTPGTTD